MPKQFKHCTFHITVQPEVSRETTSQPAPDEAERGLAKKLSNQANTIQALQKIQDEEKRKFKALAAAHDEILIINANVRGKYKKEKSRLVTSTQLNNEHARKINRLGNRNRELADEAVSLKRDVDRLNAVADRLRRERDELLDAATKPEEKPTVDNTGGAEPMIITGKDTEHVGYPDIEVPKNRKARGKLTDEEVWAIRRYVAMERGDSWIAKQLNLPNPQAVYKIRRGLSYANVPAEPKRKPTTVVAGKGEVSNDK